MEVLTSLHVINVYEVVTAAKMVCTHPPETLFLEGGALRILKAIWTSNDRMKEMNNKDISMPPLNSKTLIH